jgi:hypothetical protein
MRPRDFIAWIAGAGVISATRGRSGRRRSSGRFPVIGHLNAGSPTPFERYLAAFRGGLAEASVAGLRGHSCRKFSRGR